MAGVLDTDTLSTAQRWRKLRQNYKKCAKQLMADVVGKLINYEPWSDEKNNNIDFVLVYKPVEKKRNSQWTAAKVDRDPRLIDKEDYERSKQGDEQADMRIEYIKLLRENGLEIEIENFCSKFEEYRAIKICGTNFTMDFWAEKFLLMKPVEPPLGSVLLLKHEMTVDKMIAMYNESLYKLPPPPEHDDIEGSNRTLFLPSRYVTPTLKSVKDFIHKFKPESHDAEENFESKLKAQLENVKKEAFYKKSDAFIQLISQNEWHSKLWITKIENFIFDALYGHDPRLKLTKDNPLTRAIRAPFKVSKGKQFLGHDDPTKFYTASERALMVFRILENPETDDEKQKKCRKLTESPELDDNKAEKDYKLSDMYQKGCFETAYPLHTGGYKIRCDVSEKKQKWSEINIEKQIDMNPRQLLRYFWSSSKMNLKYQPLNIVRNYFGSGTAMYFAYIGFYNMSLVIPAIAGTAVFIYGLLQMTWTDTARHICESEEKYLMCADCYIDGTCNATYLSDYCFTTSITSVANNGAVIVFSIIMMIWLAMFLTFWKRQQSSIAHSWGTTNSGSASAEVRVKYKLTDTNVLRYNQITKKREQHITFLHRLPKYIQAFTFVAIFLAIATLTTLTITVYNYSLSVSIQRAKDYNPFTRKYANEIAICVTGSLSATLIICLSYVYRIIANKLTDRENHRTQRDHDNHLSFKIYLFEFVNYYSTLFYIAFIKGNVTSPADPRYLYGNSMKIEGCAPGGCMSEVSIQMIMIMSVQRIVPILKDIIRTLNINRIKEEMKFKLLSPFVDCCKFTQRWKDMAEQILKDLNKNRSQYVQDFELAEPTEMYQEYINNIIQLGFLTMFVTAFPLAPLICLFINIWQRHKDATRYVKRVRRPIGFKTEGIGAWMNILEVLSRIAILVNAILIAFTFDWLPLMIYKRNYETEGSSYVDFMLASHDFVREESDGSQTNQTCRYWSYIQPARADQSRFWLELVLARMLFIFLFQIIVWGAVKIIELLCGSTPKFVKERMVLEEEIAQEWLDIDSKEDIAEEIPISQSPTCSSNSKRYSPTDEVKEEESKVPLLQENTKP
ncbi:anoctamin-7-like [Bolinopsis microptera]|uniref:anoctamin-7-like n=1 Tax=Bolinopsis microptera TaxID=2820187 RepID=UPI0030797398